MITLAALLATGLAVAWAAPRLLLAGSWQPRSPRLALALWHLALAVVVGCVLVALGVAVWMAVMSSTGPHAHGVEGIVATVVGWTGLILVGGIALVVYTAAETTFPREQSPLRLLAGVPHDIEHLDRGLDLVTYEIDEPFACAVPGRPGTIAVGRGARRLLTEVRFRAVVEHERAHLRYRHHLAVSAARLYAACVPRTRAARALPRVTRLLIELMADDDAARRVGAVHLANALAVIGESTGDAGMILRAERLASRKWPSARLSATPRASAHVASLRA